MSNLSLRLGCSKSLALCLSVVLFAYATPAIAANQQVGQESPNGVKKKYQKATAEQTELTRRLAQRVAAGNGENVRIAEDQKKLVELQNDRKRFLDELIASNPDNEDYLFESAKLAAARGDRKKAINILVKLAPSDTPGYAKAHFVFAQDFYERAANENDQRGYLEFALQHVDHVLTQNKSDAKAKLLKARILAALARHESAYELYEELFELNPNYYREMVELNKQMGSEERNPLLIEEALSSFKRLANQEENQSDDRRWIVVETGITKTLQMLGRFEEAEARLEEQFADCSAKLKGGTRCVFLKRLITDNYIVWANNLADSNKSFDSLPAPILEKLLYLNTKAFRNQRDNIFVLQSLTRLALSTNSEIAAKATAIYDPVSDVNAPAVVFNQLGNNKLLNRKFSEAIRYYERAREKSPHDSAILNNLAFSYLVAHEDERNPERALQIINEAIRNLPKKVSAVERAKLIHTKATALKQMDRLRDAIELYEQGIKLRPNHVDSLRSVIECYRGLNKKPPEPYVLRLEKVDQQDE